MKPFASSWHMPYWGDRPETMTHGKAGAYPVINGRTYRGDEEGIYADLAAAIAKSDAIAGAWMPDSDIPAGWDERDAKGV